MLTSDSEEELPINIERGQARPRNVPAPAPTAASASRTSEAEAHYVANNNDKRTLIVLSIGSEYEIDPDTSPWNTVQRRDIKPKKKDLQDEVKRRSEDMAIPPRPKHWDVAACISWLKAHPITAESDILFIKKESSRVRTVLEEANREAEMNESLTRAGQWRGPVPILRLGHCLIEDDIKSCFLRRNDARRRRELDDRNSADRPLTAYELIANKWNDSTFNPRSMITNCHEDFETPIDISHTAVCNMADATPAKVEDVLTTIRTHLIRLITDWERSGQGEGGHTNAAGEDIDVECTLPTVIENSIPDPIYEVNDFKFGGLANRRRPALANRRNFLNGKPSYLLYFWELMDKHQLLASTVQRLDESAAAADANSVPTIRSSASKRRRSDDEDLRALKSVSDAITGLAKEQKLDRKERIKALRVEREGRVQERLNHLRDTLREYRRYRAEARVRHESDMVLFYDEEIKAIEDDIRGKELQLMTQCTQQTRETQESQPSLSNESQALSTP